MRHTSYADDEFLLRDPCAHAQQDLMACMQVVERASESDNWVQRRDGRIHGTRRGCRSMQGVFVRLENDDI